VPKRAALLAAPAWRRLLGAGPRSRSGGPEAEEPEEDDLAREGRGIDLDGSADGGQEVHANGASGRGADERGPAATANDGAGSNHGATSSETTERQRLESLVDVHAFSPRDLVRAARRAGLEGVRVSGQELTAGWFGWVNRTLEGSAEEGVLPRAWYLWAHHGYLTLQRLDRALLEPRLPAAVFYNLLLSARKPA
jgi:hypothetical protein